jgi:hypothetical protein
MAAQMEKRNAYRILVGKTEGKRPLGRPWRKWVDNIKMDLGEKERVFTETVIRPTPRSLHSSRF